ncbi:MAG: anion-transporting ATPase, partial [Ilumatobacteraceae bacterium]
PALFSRRQSGVVDRLSSARDLLVDEIGKGAGAVLDAALITDARRRIGAEHLDRLRAEAPDLPVLIVPELFTRATGRRVVSLVAQALAEELE